MLRALRALRVRRVLVVLLATTLGIGLCSSAQAAPVASVVKSYGEEGTAPDPGTPTVDPEAAAGAIEVTVTTSWSTAAGKSFSPPTVRSMPPLCWYGRGATGKDYYDFWTDGGQGRQSQTTDAYAAQGLLHTGYEAYATDTAGHWYEATCRYDAPADQVAAYYQSHPALYVPAGGPAPAPDTAVDPAVLAQIAFEAMELPKGEIHWNPSLAGSGATVVNMDTWVWIEDAPMNVSITATAGATSATVAATLNHLDLTAPGAHSASCKDTGVAWTKGATSTSCKIVFNRSSANQSVKPGQTLPTSTLTVTGSWTASWTSTANPTATPLDAQDITTTAEVPVAEIQSLVTTGK